MTTSRAKASTSRDAALAWFEAHVPKEGKAGHDARQDITRLRKSPNASTVEEFLADPSRPEMADWARNMSTHLKELRAVIKKMRDHARQAPGRRGRHQDYWWKSDIRRPPDGDADSDTYLKIICARIARAKDLRTVDAIGVLGGDPPPEHLARMMPALAALLDGAERIADSWPKVPRLPPGKTTDQRRKQREASAVVRFTRRILGKAAVEPADLALASIAMGKELPCKSADEFRLRNRAWDELLRRERQNRSSTQFRTSSEVEEDAKMQVLVDRARDRARTRRERASPTET